MTTRRKSAALTFLEKLAGPLTFGRAIEAIRLGEEMSQAAFARELGVSRAHLCDIEKGRKAVSPERAARFATKLGYSDKQFIRLALQDQVDRAGLKLTVDVHP